MTRVAALDRAPIAPHAIGVCFATGLVVVLALTGAAWWVREAVIRLHR